MGDSWENKTSPKVIKYYISCSSPRGWWAHGHPTRRRSGQARMHTPLAQAAIACAHCSNKWSCVLAFACHLPGIIPSSLYPPPVRKPRKIWGLCSRAVGYIFGRGNFHNSPVSMLRGNSGNWREQILTLLSLKNTTLEYLSCHTMQKKRAQWLGN